MSGLKLRTPENKAGNSLVFCQGHADGTASPAGAEGYGIRNLNIDRTLCFPNFYQTTGHMKKLFFVSFVLIIKNLSLRIADEMRRYEQQDDI